MFVKFVQIFDQVMNCLSDMGPPAQSDGENVVLGLTQAVEDMCKMSDLQRNQDEEDEENVLENKGRIICITRGKR